MRGKASSPAATEQSLSSYIAEIRRIPLLDAEEERMLAARCRRHGDRAAADRLVTSHLRLVAKIAWGYRGYGLQMSDLISEGSLGMLEAVKRFDPERGFRLSSYAPWWIRSKIHDYVLRSWSLVRVGTTSNQRKLFFNLRRLKAQLMVAEDRELSPEQVRSIADNLGVSTADVVAMSWRLSSPDASLNIHQPDNDDEWQDQLVDESSDQESALAARETSARRRALLHRALALLEPREREIITARRLCHKPAPLIALAARFGLSSERIRQIECSTLAKLNKLLRAMSRAPSSPHLDRPVRTAATGPVGCAGAEPCPCDNR